MPFGAVTPASSATVGKKSQNAHENPETPGVMVPGQRTLCGQTLLCNQYAIFASTEKEEGQKKGRMAVEEFTWMATALHLQTATACVRADRRSS